MRGTILICFRKFQPEQFKVKIYVIEIRHRKGQTGKFYWLMVLQAHLQNRLLKAILTHLRKNISIIFKMAVYYPEKPAPLHYNEKYPRYTKDGKYKPGLVNIPGILNIRLRQFSFQWVFQCSDLNIKKLNSSTCLNYYFLSSKKFKSLIWLNTVEIKGTCTHT